MKGVVTRESNQYAVEELTIDPPKAGELGIRMAATGVCHSDLSVVNDTLPLPRPCVLGHEGAGVVETVGPGVTGFAPGDHVVLSFTPRCGSCWFCLRQMPQFCANSLCFGPMMDGTARVHDKHGKDVGVMQFLGCMAERAVVPAVSAVKIDKSIPLDKAALVGCGVMTGVGAAINTARVTPGASVAVFGCGGVGLSVIQGCRLAGAGTIIGVDLADNKLEMARRFGATNVVNGGKQDPVGAVKDLTGGVGADFTFEVVGIPALMVTAYNAARRGGTVVIVGVGRMTDSVPFNALMLSMEGKTIKGSYYGDANVQADFPKLLGLYQGGRLNLDDMVTRTYRIEDAPQAIADLEQGRNARGVIVY
ncbi:MAG TPA: Zn-dependent alcohol dehydrogenase [Candidatus Limnocylindria bacterium]|nr:Zn-dependent alcohol dehydrogenase [Candidatus Limnocylindria bacterium]